MMKKEYSITIASVPDRDGLIAELWYGDVMYGELSLRNNEVYLELYSKQDGTPWQFKLEDVLEHIVKAKQRLILSNEKK